MEVGQIPPGPQEKYKSTVDLLKWIGQQFESFGTIYKASIYGTNVYVTRDPKHAQHVLIDNWQNYVKGQFIKRVGFLLGNGLMVSEGEFWKRQRRMIQPAFHRDVIGALSKMMTSRNLALLEKWKQAAQKKEPVNVTRDVSSMVLEVVLIAIFGNDYEQIRADFSILSEDSARNMEFASSFRSLGKKILRVAERRRRQEPGCADIFGMLLGAQDHNGKAMTDASLINEVMTLIVAGHETTASTLAWTWYLISQHGEVDEKLSNELVRLLDKDVSELAELPQFAYTRQILDETMRLFPAGWLMTRRALMDDQLGAYLVPAGTEIYISPYFIQRNPDLWENPNRFDPGRFDPGCSKDRHRLAMLPFSAGPRNCIGEFFARIEMQIHLIIIARHLRLEYVQREPLDLDAGVNLRNKYDFYMTPVLRN